MKSVALVGFYDPTLPYAKDTTADEVWVPNHGAMVMEKDIPRPTRVFEIHKKHWFTRNEMAKHAEYWEWLQQDHGYPIYLQEAIPEIKRGVVYPFDDVVADLFPHLLRRYKDGREVSEKMLTSSASFMLALAIHEKFERVEIYGIGMSAGTEYAYQYPGFMYMIGLANGRGIDVVNMEDAPICKSLVYAYEAIPLMDRKRLIDLRVEYDIKLREAQKKAREVIAAHNSGENQDQNAAKNASDLAACYTGAVQIIDILLENGSEQFSRQGLETQRRFLYRAADDFKARTNQLAGEYMAALKRKKEAQARTIWQNYLNTRASMHANSGAVQAMDNLILECDLLKPDHEITVTIQDQEQGA